jgi:ActR/RegA family two-component response regulator
MNSKTYILFIIDDDDLFRESIRVRLERDGVRLDVAAKDSMALSAASKWLGVMI